MKQGQITSWDSRNFVGTIIVRNPPVERYWLRAGEVRQGPEPYIGAQVEFDVSDKPVKPGKLAIAIKVVVLEGAR